MFKTPSLGQPLRGLSTKLFFPLKNHIANSSPAEWSHSCHGDVGYRRIFFSPSSPLLFQCESLCTSITAKDANGSFIIYLDTNNAVPRVFINRLGSFFSMLPETQNKHFLVTSIAIGRIACELWAKENYFWYDPRIFIIEGATELWFLRKNLTSSILVIDHFSIEHFLKK